MLFSAEEITAWLGSFLWPFFRIGAFVMVAPIFGGRVVPMRLKLIVAIGLSLVVVPVTNISSKVDVLSLDSFLIIFHQILIGIALGFCLQLIFSALATAGQLIGSGMGLGFAAMVDPNNGIQIPTVSQFYNLIGILMFIALDGHLAATAVLIESFNTLPADSGVLDNNSMWKIVVSGGWIFSGAVLIALPIITSLLVINVAFGVMTRASPQLNVFAIGFPITLTVGFVLMWITLPNFMPSFIDLTDNALALMRHMVKGQ